MARRSEYDVALKCECGNAGRITYKENDNEVYHGDSRIFVSLSGDFRSEGSKVICGACGKDLKNA